MWREILETLGLSLRSLRDLFFVRHCVVCGARLEPPEHYLCGSCLEDIPFTYFWSYSENAAMERMAPLCHIREAASLFFYRTATDEARNGAPADLIKAFKYEGEVALGTMLGEMLGQRLAQGGLYGAVDIVVPVPLHPLKKFRRGFNQAEVVAQAVCGAMVREDAVLPDGGSGCFSVSPDGASDRPAACSRRMQRRPLLCTDLLRRSRYTSTQTRRTGAERASNVAGAFRLAPKTLARLKSDGAKHVLLVDDVLTTGSTLAACAKVLEPHFTVSVATLAFVER
ncbi:MAG: ComF family protein [Bacteroidales bacterium]|nr:ComF family protein [Bacteroidales bacterium]